MAKPRTAKARRTRPPGDDLGAADLGRRVAERLRALRREREMSLDELAQVTGVSRAALSQIETCRTNPTVALLWKVAVGFGVPFADLLGESARTVSVLRRAESQVLRSADGKLESRSLAPSGSNPYVELYELRLAGRASHASEPHAPGVRELVAVLSGELRMTVGTEVHDIRAGDSIWFTADIRHIYENPRASEVRCHNIIMYPR